MQGASSVRLANIAAGRARASERAALAAVLPTLTLNGSYTRYDQAIERTGIVVRAEDQFDGNVVAAESVTIGEFTNLSARSAATRAAELTLQDAQRVTKAAVARAFYTVLAAKRTAALARIQYTNAARQLQAVRGRNQVGVATRLDVDRAELAALEAERRIDDADAALTRSWDSLGDAIGTDEPVDADETGSEPPPADRTLADYERLATSRTDVQASRASRTAAERTLTTAWMAFGPTASVSWTGAWSSSTTTFRPDEFSWTALATLSLPLYDGGARYAAIHDAELAQQDAQERITITTRRARNEVRDARRRVQTAERAIHSAERSAELASRQTQAAMTAYQSGALTGVELDDARKSLELAQIEVILRGLDRQLALVDLLSAAGLL